MQIRHQLSQKQPGHRHLRTVKKQRIGKRPQHSCDNISRVIPAIRVHEVTHCVLHKAKGQGVHRAAYHGAQRPAQKAPGNPDIIKNRDGAGIGQGDAHGHHQGGKYQNLYFFGICQSIPPVGAGKWGTVQLHNKIPPSCFGSPNIGNAAQRRSIYSAMRQRDAEHALQAAAFRPADNSPSRRHWPRLRGQHARSYSA